MSVDWSYFRKDKTITKEIYFPYNIKTFPYFKIDLIQRNFYLTICNKGGNTRKLLSQYISDLNSKLKSKSKAIAKPKPSWCLEKYVCTQCKNQRKGEDYYDIHELILKRTYSCTSCLNHLAPFEGLHDIVHCIDTEFLLNNSQLLKLHHDYTQAPEHLKYLKETKDKILTRIKDKTLIEEIEKEFLINQRLNKEFLSFCGILFNYFKLCPYSCLLRKSIQINCNFRFDEFLNFSRLDDVNAVGVLYRNYLRGNLVYKPPGYLETMTTRYFIRGQNAQGVSTNLIDAFCLNEEEIILVTNAGVSSIKGKGEICKGLIVKKDANDYIIKAAKFSDDEIVLVLSSGKVEIFKLFRQYGQSYEGNLNNSIIKGSFFTEELNTLSEDDKVIQVTFYDVIVLGKKVLISTSDAIGIWEVNCNGSSNFLCKFQGNFLGVPLLLRNGKCVEFLKEEIMIVDIENDKIEKRTKVNITGEMHSVMELNSSRIFIGTSSVIYVFNYGTSQLESSFFLKENLLSSIVVNSNEILLLFREYFSIFNFKEVKRNYYKKNEFKYSSRLFKVGERFIVNCSGFGGYLIDGEEIVEDFW